MSQLHRPSPSYWTFGYCSCKQDTKEQYWGQQFCQKARDILVRLTKMTQHAKKVMSDSPGLVDLPDRQVLFFGEIQITERL